jgi:hypothetical protein
MMKGLARVLIVGATALVVTSSASAAPIMLLGGTAGTISIGSPNDFIPGLLPGPTIGGYFGADIQISVPVITPVTIDFLGAEAGFVNSFEFFGSTLFTHPGGGATMAPSLAAPLGSLAEMISATGLLPFRFHVNGGAGSVQNGANPDATGFPNFFVSCNPFSAAAGAGGTDCTSIYLFLDDGGAGPDVDHDDLLVRIAFPAAVPEPAALALVSLGLLGFALRRFQQ